MSIEHIRCKLWWTNKCSLRMKMYYYVCNHRIIYTIRIHFYCSVHFSFLLFASNGIIDWTNKQKKLRIHENNFYGGLNTIEYRVHRFWFTQIQYNSYILWILFRICLPIASSMRMRVAEPHTKCFNRLIELINSNFQLLYRSEDTVISRIHTFRCRWHLLKLLGYFPIGSHWIGQYNEIWIVMRFQSNGPHMNVSSFLSFSIICFGSLCLCLGMRISNWFLTLTLCNWNDISNSDKTVTSIFNSRFSHLND